MTTADTVQQLRRQMTPEKLRLALCLGALFLAAESFVYFGYGAGARGTARDAMALARQIEAAMPPLRNQLGDLDQALRKPDTDARGRANAFLREVDGAASHHAVRVVRLVPKTGADGVLDVELGATFPDFLRFTADMERLGASMRDLHIKGGEGKSVTGEDDGGRQAISFALLVPEGKPLAGPFVEALVARLSDPQLRDLSMPAGAALDDGSERAPLPGKHRLTGITRAGKAFAATIDGLDYQAGDSIGDTSISDIRSDRVLLSQGRQRYVLRFTVKEK